MAELSISKIQMGEKTYQIQDARFNTLVTSTGLRYVGTVDGSTLDDGSTGSPKIKGKESYTASLGDIVLQEYESNGATIHREFIYSGEKWDEFGSTGAIGSMAFADEASGSTSVEHSIKAKSDSSVNVAIPGLDVTVKGQISISTSGYIDTAGTYKDTFLTGYTSPDKVGFSVTTISTVKEDTVAIPAYTGSQKKLAVTTISTVGGTTTVPAGYGLDTSILQKASIASGYSANKGKLNTIEVVGFGSDKETAVKTLAFDKENAVASITSTPKSQTSDGIDVSYINGTTINVASHITKSSDVSVWTNLKLYNDATSVFKTATVGKTDGVNITGIGTGQMCDISISGDTMILNPVTVTAINNVATIDNGGTVLTGLADSISILTGGAASKEEVIKSVLYSDVNVPVLATDSMHVITSVALQESVITNITTEDVSVIIGCTSTGIDVYNTSTYTVADGTVVANTEGNITMDITPGDSKDVLVNAFWNNAVADNLKSDVSIGYGISSTGTVDVATKAEDNTVVATGSLADTTETDNVGDTVVVSVSEDGTSNVKMVVLDGSIGVAVTANDVSVLTSIGTASYFEDTSINVRFNRPVPTDITSTGTTEGVDAKIDIAEIAGLLKTDSQTVGITVKP